MQGVSVSYRKRGNRWNIRFQKKGKKEVVESLPGTLREKTIKNKCIWYREQIALGRENPFVEEERNVDVPINYLIDKYCDSHLESGFWTKKTYNTNESRLRITLKSIYYKPLADVEKDDFQDCVKSLSVSAITKKGYRATVNSFLTWLNDEGFSPRRWKTSLSKPDKLEIRNKSDIKYVTWQQVHDICRALRFRERQLQAMYNYPKGKGAEFYQDLFWFMFYTLLRKEEVPKLFVRDLMPGQRLRVHGKGGKVDIIPLPPPAFKLAKKFAKGARPSEPLIVKHMNRPYKHLKEGIRLALGEDHDTGFHQFRHGGVVHYFTLGKPIQFVSKLCRHATAQVTLEVYGNVIPDGLAKAFSDVNHEPAT